LFLCEECFGRDILCQKCCVDCHKCFPLHVINKWNSQYFEHTSLKDIGLFSHRQQLLHCDWFPSTVHQSQTVCTRRVLEHFLLLTWFSKVSTFAYYQTLEHLTDNTGISVPKVSGHLSLDTGRGHVENGIASLQPGDLVLHCPACLQPGINLPRGWETIDASLKCVFFLL
ncbi:hypothetical protein BDR07DRAFT_1306110, partial [Suillus spraguei]